MKTVFLFLVPSYLNPDQMNRRCRCDESASCLSLSIPSVLIGGTAGLGYRRGINTCHRFHMSLSEANIVYSSIHLLFAQRSCAVSFMQRTSVSSEKRRIDWRKGVVDSSLLAGFRAGRGEEGGEGGEPRTGKRQTSLTPAVGGVGLSHPCRGIYL